MQELIRRGAIKAAIAGREGVSLQILLKFIQKYVDFTFSIPMYVLCYAKRYFTYVNIEGYNQSVHLPRLVTAFSVCTQNTW